MRWLLTASLVSTLVAVPAVAQKSVSMGHAGGFSGGHIGGFSPPRGFAAPHISGGFNVGTHFSPAPVMAPRNINTPPQYHWNNLPGARLGNQSVHLPNKYPAPSPGHHNGHPSYPYSHYRQPYVPYFYARSTYLVPGLLNSYWDSSYNSYGNDDSAYSNYSQQPAENNGGDYGPEPAPPYEPQQQMPDVPPPPPADIDPLPQAAVTLVFKDGHSQEIHNYAMTKTTLYVLDDAASGRRPEIALEQIDVPATERANQGTGVHFAVPTRVD